MHTSVCSRVIGGKLMKTCVCLTDLVFDPSFPLGKTERLSLGHLGGLILKMSDACFEKHGIIIMLHSNAIIKAITKRNHNKLKESK